MKIAVYGTLLKGCSNHGLLKNSEFLGEDIINGFLMYNIGYFPGIKKGDGKIKIEVYNVSDDTFKRLDTLEGYPHLYDREIVNTKFGTAWIYIYNGNINNKKHIEDGSWRTFYNKDL